MTPIPTILSLHSHATDGFQMGPEPCGSSGSRSRATAEFPERVPQARGKSPPELARWHIIPRSLFTKHLFGNWEACSGPEGPSDSAVNEGGIGQGSSGGPSTETSNIFIFNEANVSSPPQELTGP